MDEELIKLVDEEIIEVDPIEVVDSKINAEDLEQTVETEEHLDVVEVDGVEEVVVEMEESVGWVKGDSTKHYSLSGRDEPNQHPISAISGLRAELDEIESLKTVYSDRVGIANYYEWADADYDEYGYFVNLVPGTTKIQICDGSNIFGVSVDGAGFVGGQNDQIPRSGRYGLIATSGLVRVRCELDVEVGDNVVCNAYGFARRSDSNCGYEVLALVMDESSGVEYAIISLGVQADVTNTLGCELDNLSDRLQKDEANIISAVNVANQAYNKSVEASKSSSVSEEAVKEALKAILDAEKNIEDFEDILTSTNNTAALAKSIAEGAVVAASSMKNEAVNRANDAWSKANSVSTECNSLCAKIDKYSVGKYSQAYGLTVEQARGILEIGLIYVPTKHIDSDYHKETYEYSKDGTSYTYEREFIPGYLYQWDYVPNVDIGVGWNTVDETPSVYFSSIEPSINNRLAYWYTDGDVITDIEGNINTYDSYTLYRWEEDHWLSVATLKGNVNNRAVSEVYQTTNQISLTLNNARGSFASIDERLTDTESRVISTTEWVKGSDVSGQTTLSNLTVIEQKSDDGGSSICLAVADKDGNKVLKGAHIVIGQSDGEDSYINIEAADINLDGYVQFTNLAENNPTKTIINGNNITTGEIRSANYVKNSSGSCLSLMDGTFDSTYFKVSSDGKITSTGGKIGGWSIGTNEIHSGNAGINTGSTYTKASLVSSGTSPVRFYCGNGDRVNGKFVVLDDGSLYASAVDIEGKITSSSATIDGGKVGGWSIAQTYLHNGDTTNYLRLSTTKVSMQGTTEDGFALEASWSDIITAGARFSDYYGRILNLERRVAELEGNPSSV